jgi:hypothetical protein
MMSVRDSILTERQYTDMMLAIGADHIAAASSGEAMLLLAIPVLWIVGVIVFVAFKLHSR